MCVAINEFTGAKSTDRSGLSEPSVNKADIASFQYISKQIDQTLQSADTYTFQTDEKKAEFSFENVKNTTLKIENVNNLSDDLYRSIDNTRTVLDEASKISSQKIYSKTLSSSDGVLATSRGIIGLTSLKTAEDKPRTISSSIANLVGGIGTLLKSADIPEAEFLSFTGKLIGLNVERIDLRDNIKKNDARSIAGSIVSSSKSVWGAVVSGVNVAKIGATFGATFELISSETYGAVTGVATKVGNIASKIALPFAVAGTGLIFWDWRQAVNKANSKEQEINNLLSKSINNSKPDLNLFSEFKTLQENSHYLGLSFAASAISTAALITSVAVPSTAIITAPLTIAGSIVSSLLTLLADDKNRESYKARFSH
jgi:hypothetical protein